MQLLKIEDLQVVGTKKQTILLNILGNYLYFLLKKNVFSVCANLLKCTSLNSLHIFFLESC